MFKLVSAERVGGSERNTQRSDSDFKDKFRERSTLTDSSTRNKPQTAL